MALVTNAYNKDIEGSVSFLNETEEQDKMFLQVQWLRMTIRKLERLDDEPGDTLKRCINILLLT